jgi:DMSO/TMAO reductase YedYZ molybdopterin-dependent catalytic subunit
MARAAIRQTVGAALIAASLSVIAALALRYVASVATPAELFADQATTRIPLPIFERLLTTFGPVAKHLYLIAALVAEAAFTGLTGLAYVALRRVVMARWPGRANAALLSWFDAPAIALALYVVSAGGVAPIVGGGFLGAGLFGGASATLLSQLAPDCVFAIALVWQVRAGSATPHDALVSGSATQASVLSRRALFQQSATAVALLGAGIALWEALTSGLGSALGAGRPQATQPSLSLSDIPNRITPAPVPVYGPWTPVSGQSAELTAASNFYYVSKNLAGDPSVSGASWKLSISGMVDKPYSLSYDELRALPRMSQYHTLECISNEVGGNLMSNGLFVGARLADVLNAAGIQSGATEMVFSAADGYSDSLHLSQALDDRSMIAYLLDGEPLPLSHGFPARLLIPGLYGMKNGKWLTELAIDAGSYRGYWELRGWTREALVKLMSRIDTPHDGDLLIAERPTFIAGVAYSGAEGVGRVDVSVDGGQSWSQASLRRPLGALTWTLWEYPWRPESGKHVVVVRAIDLAGRVQTPAIAEPLPDGASGYHAITVTVG